MSQITTLLRETQTGTVAAASTGTGLKVENAKGYCMEIDVTVATAAATTYSTGLKETTTVLCVADAGAKEVQTLTFPAFAAITDRDYIVVEDTLGGKWAVYADKTGSSVAPTGAIYTAIPAANKVKADISADTTAAQVAARFELAFDGLTGFTAKIVTDDTAADGTMTFTQTKVGPVVNPVPKNLDDTGAGSLAGVQTTGGVASNLNNKYINLYSSPDESATEVRNVFWFNVNGEGTAPVITGDVPTEVAITLGAQADTDVAAALNTAIDGTADLTSTVASATITVVNADVGNVTAGSNGSGASPGFTITVTQAGTENAFSIDGNTLTSTNHGYYTGLKVAATTTTTLPTGLSATDYYVIRVDADTIKLATSAANALAGTAVNITGNGVGTHTLTPAAIGGASYKLQGAILTATGAEGTYVDLSVTNNVTATAGFLHEKVDPQYDYVRVVWAMTAGQVAYTINLNVKGAE